MGLKLFVGNLTYTTGEVELRDAFSGCGAIEEIEIVSDRYTGRPRGFAFVTFSSEDEGRAAIAKLNGADLAGNRLNVSEAKARESVSASGKVFSSPNRKKGAFHARGKRRF